MLFWGVCLLGWGGCGQSTCFGIQLLIMGGGGGDKKKLKLPFFCLFYLVLCARHPQEWGVGIGGWGGVQPVFNTSF